MIDHKPYVNKEERISTDANGSIGMDNPIPKLRNPSVLAPLIEDGDAV